MVRKTLRVVILCLVVTSIAMIALSYTGTYLPIGDSLAVGRLYLAAGLCGLAGLTYWGGAARLATIAALIAVLSGGPIISGFFAPQQDAGVYSLYQKNLLRRAWPRYGLRDEILKLDPEFVTLQEVSPHNLRFMSQLFTGYSGVLMCAYTAVGKVAVLTRLPVVAGSKHCGGLDGFAALQVELENGSRLWVVSVHLRWPFPFSQAEQAKRIAQYLESLDGPVLIGGDFNMVPWGASVRRIAHAAKADRLGPYAITFPDVIPFFPLPIDHVLVPNGSAGAFEIRPKHGSDHLGVLARFDLPD